MYIGGLQMLCDDDDDGDDGYRLLWVVIIQINRLNGADKNDKPNNIGLNIMWIFIQGVPK